MARSSHHNLKFICDIPTSRLITFLRRPHSIAVINFPSYQGLRGGDRMESDFEAVLTEAPDIALSLEFVFDSMITSASELQLLSGAGVVVCLAISDSTT